MIGSIKLVFFEEKLSKTIGKPKALWESLKSLIIPYKTVKTVKAMLRQSPKFEKIVVKPNGISLH